MDYKEVLIPSAWEVLSTGVVLEHSHGKISCQPPTLSVELNQILHFITFSNNLALRELLGFISTFIKEGLECYLSWLIAVLCRAMGAHCPTKVSQFRQGSVQMLPESALTLLSSLLCCQCLADDPLTKRFWDHQRATVFLCCKIFTG